ncbi:MAG: D-alanyl-D-alanine carboxypeptidase [Verrucomicrobia bacterium]|nr:D-alanyl-D-alanine carboxypeptidase [Verrucomicrobiota bacterium]MBV9276538.1 D-alanyl-D-alanine carboxypeptidase [Verrucomicrobiota bacterium]
MATLARTILLLVACLTPVVTRAQVAAAYILADHTSGYVLESYKSDQKRPIASLTKIATAKVVLDWAAKTGVDLSQLIAIPLQAIRPIGNNPMGLQPDDQMSYRDLLYASLMASDNTAANALAYNVGAAIRAHATSELQGLGAIETFVSQMNALARELGTERTLFVNADGLEPQRGRQPYSTAADVVKLVAYAMNDAGFRFYVSQKERKVSFLRGGQTLQFMLHNTNELVGTNGIDGVKTGTTPRAGECLALSAQRDPEIRKDGETTYVTPRRVDLVILGATDRFAAGTELLARAWSLYDQWAAAGRPAQTSKH